MANSNTYIKSRKHSGADHSPRAGLVATAAALASLGLCAQAQSLPPEATLAQASAGASRAAPSLKEVTVEGSRSTGYEPAQLSSPKFTQPQVDTTQTVSIIKEQVLQEQGATTLTEALRNVPGAGTFYAGENGNTSTGDTIYMRGFDTSNSIYVDGVRDVGSISRDVFNTEQVEVTKGPAGTDYGRSAPTGAINMVTKQPSLTDSFGASLGAGSGSYKRSTVDWNKSLTGMGGAAFRLNAMVQDAGVAGRDRVANDRWGIAPSFAFGLDTATRTYLNLLHVKQSNVPDGGVPTIGLPGYSNTDTRLNAGRPVDPSRFYGTSADHDDVTADMVTLRVEHDFTPDTTLRNTTRWGRTRQDYLLTAFMTLSSNNSNNPADWTVARNLPTFKNQVNEIVTNQTHLTTRLATGGIRHDLSTGVEITREKQDNYGTGTTGAWPTANLYNPQMASSGLGWARNGADSHGSTNTFALYAFDTLKFNDQWQANAGVRLDRYKTRYDALAVCGGRGGPACGTKPAGTVLPSASGLEASDTLLSWKIGALYKPAPNGSVYVNYALSQQPPGGANFTLSTAASNANNPNLDPQKAKTAEIGTKWELMDKRLLLTGALFRTEITNEIVTNSDGTVGQTGKKTVQGLELGATGQITPVWGVTAGYTLQDTKVDTGAVVAQDGSRGLTYTPRNAFSLWTSYQLPFGLTLAGGARYSGGLKRGTDGAVGTPNFTEAFWVFDAMASYRINKNADIQLNFYNLFDKDYVAAINKSGYRYFPGIARSVRVTANLRF